MIDFIAKTIDNSTHWRNQPEYQLQYIPKNIYADIYCCYHNESHRMKYPHIDSTLIWHYGPDDPLNFYMGEFSMFKRIWMNEMSDYIGTCHYRRRLPLQLCYDFAPHLNERTAIVASDKMVSEGLGRFEQFYLPTYMKGIYDGWETITKDYEEYINQTYVTPSKYIEEYNRNLFLSRCCIFLRREDFSRLCDFIFGYHDYIDKKYNLNYDPQKYKEYIKNIIKPANTPLGHLYNQRVGGIISEFLYNVYVQTNFTNSVFVDYLYLKYDQVPSGDT